MKEGSDEQHMRRALDLARAGVGLVSPNPVVGAVVVDASGREVGSGTHTYDGMKHAEVLALEQAGDKARGGALYLNLEPCSHQGRTGPCADAVIAAGISRVICSMSIRIHGCQGKELPNSAQPESRYKSGSSKRKPKS